MNEEAKKMLDEITLKDPSELTKDEIAFLNARRTYLRPEQRQIFSSVLAKEKKEEPAHLETTEVKKTKK